MNTITIIFEFIKKYYQLILFALVLVLSVSLFQTCSTLQTERDQREFIEKQNAQNLNALKDSLTVTFDKKLKAFVYEKDNYMVDELKDLKKYNKELYDKLNKVKGEIIAAIEASVVADLSGVVAGNELITVDAEKNIYGLKFTSRYKDAGFEQDLEGMSKFKATHINNDWMLEPDSTLFTKNITQMNITYGFREDDKKYEVFAITSSSKVKINNINGVFVLDKVPVKPVKPKRWGFGPYIGAGLNTDINLSNPRIGWSAGISVHYDLISWRMGKK